MAKRSAQCIFLSPKAFPWRVVMLQAVFCLRGGHYQNLFAPLAGQHVEQRRACVYCKPFTYVGNGAIPSLNSLMNHVSVGGLQSIRLSRLSLSICDGIHHSTASNLRPLLHSELCGIQKRSFLCSYVFSSTNFYLFWETTRGQWRCFCRPNPSPVRLKHMFFLAYTGKIILMLL